MNENEALSLVVELELPQPLGEEETQGFDLESAVCSHGMFMMSPNHWDPLTKTLLRPLRLSDDDDDEEDDSKSSVVVRISHPQPHSLLLHVFGTHPLSPHQQQQLIAQVRRMLRLSESDETNVREFQKKKKIHSCSSGSSSSSGNFNFKLMSRVFRSPTLFEDMIKCILLCNCQWPRTLSMARALCDLQLELQCRRRPSSSSSSADLLVAADTKLNAAEADTHHFIVPNTPAPKESNRRRKSGKPSETNAEHVRSLLIPNDACSPFDIHCYSRYGMGNFPSPRELASLDEGFLAKRCKLGYRARRILKLAQSVVEGRIQLKQLEQVSNNGSLASYELLNTKLKEIDGFGPFTCANVLMCMGFYHVIPTDSETIRHLYQVHGKKSSIQTVQRDVEEIYEKYAPFQFLAYWSEVWHFYEKTFGKLSEMPHSDYKLITASNMRSKATPNKPKSKRKLKHPEREVLLRYFD